MRGRTASAPRRIPAKGWGDVLSRVWRQMGDDNVNLISAGVALYGLLSVFPSLIVGVSLYGLFAEPSDIGRHLQSLHGVLPAAGVDLFQQHLSEVASQRRTTLNLGLGVSALLMLWSARRGMNALILACNITYNERDKRNFFKRVGLSLLFTFCAVLALVIVAGLAVVVPVLLEALPLPGFMQGLFEILRWAALWLLMTAGLTLLYRYGPSRSRARWTWLSWGAAIAATVWLLGSILFTSYVRNFGNFSETYGALGSVIILLLWFHLSALVVVLGAELNAEIEHQTEMDTTVGPDRPLGERGAYVADTVGRAHGS